jgi:hypothetical protein
MKLNYKYLLFAVGLTGLAACSSETDIGNESKTPISFVSGIQQVGTTTTSRAVTGGSQMGFQTGSKMLLRASNNWKSTANVVTVTGTAQAASGTTNAITVPLYWDDFGAGDLTNSDVASTGITVYGIAVDDGGTNSSTPTSLSSWTALPIDFSGDQSAWNTAPHSKDYVISHNVSGLKYVKGSEPTANLAFSHPFSKVTLNIKYGNGFTTTNTPNFIHLIGFNTKGTLDITSGNYTVDATTPTGAVTALKQETKADGYDFTYDASVLPGRDFTAVGEAIALNIDNNVYHINTSDFVGNIDAGYKTMLAGANYIFNITVNKTAVTVTSAYVTDWTGVTLSSTPSNGTEANLDATGTNFTSDFELYISSTTDTNNLTATATTSGFSGIERYYKYDTSSYVNQGAIVYWPDNNTYFHFRGIVPNTSTLNVDATNGDNVTLTTAANAFTDVLWGAPYKSSAISPALGPTKDNIKLEFTHQMSQLLFVIQTTSDASAVDLTTADPTVVLTCSPSASLRLGNATINNYGANASFSPTKSTYTLLGTSYTGYLVGAVPQSTSGRSLVITTKDGNVYKITNLSTIKTTDNKDVAAWAPGKVYIYTLTLAKSKISLTVSAADWTKIEGAGQTVYIQ